jgi:hypothetical protein
MLSADGELVKLRKFFEPMFAAGFKSERPCSQLPGA